MKKTLIFSDVHLKVVPDDRPRHEEFTAFLRRFSPDEFERFICLGDLFDFWFEYKSVVFSDFFGVLRAFAEIREAGVAVDLICGNHDFWAGRFLRDELGFTIHPNVMEHQFGSLRGHLVHGDGINPEDWRYRAYKKFARNPLVVSAFRCIHPDLAMAIARGVSHGSRTYLGTKNPYTGPEATSLRRYASGVLERDEADVVLCGHAHAPVHETVDTPHGPRTYINTGDWLDHRSHTIWDGQRFEQFVEGPGVAVAEE